MGSRPESARRPCLRVGLDLSLQSPAVAVCDAARPEQVTVLVMQQRQRESAPWASAWLRQGSDGPFQVRVERAPYTFKTAGTDRWERMHQICTAIVAFVERHRAAVHPDAHVVGQFEGYAMNADSCSVTKLAELGGLVRYAFYERGWAFGEIPPSKAKSSFAQNGHASKAEMAAAYARHRWPSLEGALGVKPDAHPYEDAIDAVAVLRAPPPDPDAGLKAQARRAKKRRLTHVLADRVSPACPVQAHW